MLVKLANLVKRYSVFCILYYFLWWNKDNHQRVAVV